MTYRKRVTRQMSMIALGLTLLGTTVSTASARNAYPADQSQVTGPLLYGFLPGRNHLLPLASAPSHTILDAAQNAGSIRYQFEPGGNRMHVVQ